MSMIIAAMPAHNEDERIAKVVLGAKKHVDKVVVVDDGSTDATVEIAEALGALVVRHEENRGYGAALRTCFETARELDADMMVILDPDGQHDPKWRIAGMKVLNLFTRLHGVETTDSQSGYRAYSRRAIEKIPITVRYDIENTSSR